MSNEFRNFSTGLGLMLRTPLIPPIHAHSAIEITIDKIKGCGEGVCFAIPFGSSISPLWTVRKFHQSALNRSEGPSVRFEPFRRSISPLWTVRNFHQSALNRSEFPSVRFEPFGISISPLWTVQKVHQSALNRSEFPSVRFEPFGISISPLCTTIYYSLFFLIFLHVNYVIFPCKNTKIYKYQTVTKKEWQHDRVWYCVCLRRSVVAEGVLLIGYRTPEVFINFLNKETRRGLLILTTKRVYFSDAQSYPLMKEHLRIEANILRLDNPRGTP